MAAKMKIQRNDNSTTVFFNSSFYSFTLLESAMIEFKDISDITRNGDYLTFHSRTDLSSDKIALEFCNFCISLLR